MLRITRDGAVATRPTCSTGTVSVLDLDHRKLVTVIQAAPRTQRIALSADDHWAFTADQTALRLVVIDTSTNPVVARFRFQGSGRSPGDSRRRWLLAAIPR